MPYVVELGRLLQQLFSEHELRTFTLSLPQGAEMARNLPGFGASLAQIANNLSQQLHRRHLISDGLFARLVAERPAAQEPINAVRNICVSASQAKTRQPSPNTSPQQGSGMPDWLKAVLAVGAGAVIYSMTTSSYNNNQIGFLRSVLQYADHNRLGQVLDANDIPVPRKKADRINAIIDNLSVDGGVLDACFTARKLGEMWARFGLDSSVRTKRDRIAVILDALEDM